MPGVKEQMPAWHKMNEANSKALQARTNAGQLERNVGVEVLGAFFCPITYIWCSKNVDLGAEEPIIYLYYPEEASPQQPPPAPSPGTGGVAPPPAPSTSSKARPPQKRPPSRTPPAGASMPD